MSQPSNRHGIAQNLWEPLETNPITLKMLEFSQLPNQKLETVLFNRVGPELLKITHHEDLLTWIESDEVAPFFNEFRRSWLEPEGEANSFADLRRRVHHPPRVLDLFYTLMEDFYLGTGKFLDTKAGKIGPRHKNVRSRNRRKKNWTDADHWALFAVQVYARASHKADKSWCGADLPMEEREFPSLWPGAEEIFHDDALIGLYMLLRCLVERYYIERKHQVLLERALEREETGF